MKYMFQYAEQFDRDLGRWQVGKVTDMGHMFELASEFTGKGLENWDVSSVVSMSASQHHSII